MQLSHSLRVVTASLDGDLLEALARADAAFTGRQLARLVGASTEGARQALVRLVEQGIVQRDPAGAAQMYRLNRDHLAAPAITALAFLRQEFLDRTRRQLAGWVPAAAYAALFGSTSRGQERPDSDLDLFLLRPAAVDADDIRWRGQLVRLAGDVTLWTGNDARILEVGQAEIADQAGPDSVLDDVLRDGIPLAGDAGILRAALRSLRSPG